MDLPTPPHAVAALAAFVRERLAEVSDTIVPRLLPRPDAEVVTTVRPDSHALAAARQFATVVVGAAAPFAPNPYARARLIRQMHATGLLTADEVLRVSRATAILGDPQPTGAVVDVDVVPDGADHDADHEADHNADHEADHNADHEADHGDRRRDSPRSR